MSINILFHMLRQNSVPVNRHLSKSKEEKKQNLESVARFLSTGTPITGPKQGSTQEVRPNQWWQRVPSSPINKTKPSLIWNISSRHLHQDVFPFPFEDAIYPWFSWKANAMFGVRGGGSSLRAVMQRTYPDCMWHAAGKLFSVKWDVEEDSELQHEVSRFPVSR